METKIIIIEDDETWRFLYRNLLRNLADIVVVGEFERAEVALEQIPQLSPDIAIVDISLPGMSGLAFAEKMREYPAVKVVLISSHQREYLSHQNLHGFLVVDKGNIDAIAASIENAVSGLATRKGIEDFI